MAVQEFRGGMHHHIRTQREWLLKIGRHERVVHDQFCSAGVTIWGDCLIRLTPSADSSASQPRPSGVLPDGPFYCARSEYRRKTKLRAKIGHYLVEKARRSAVHIVPADQVIALLQEALCDRRYRRHAAGKDVR